MQHFTDTADIWRPTNSSEPYGSKEVLAVHLTGVPCRLSEKEQKGFNSLTGQWVIMTDYRLQVGHDVDVLVGDQVRNIRRDRQTAVNVILEVTGGGKRRGHLSRLKSFSLKSIGVEEVDA